jgi:hypothetical protein
MRTPWPDPPPQVWEGAIEITVKNVSGQVVHLEESDLTYELSVLDSSGNPVPRTEYGKQIETVQRDRSKMGFSPAIGIYDLRPGEEHTRTWGLSMFFKIQPGQDYRVKLSRLPDSMAAIDKTGKRVALRELSRTLKGTGRPSVR